MIGVLSALIVSFGLLFFSNTIHIEPFIMQITASIVGLLFFALYGLTLSFAFTPLQRVEQKLTPRLLELFREDQHIHFIWYWVVFFSLASIVLGFVGISLGAVNPNYILVGWLIGFGVTVDLYRHR